jgi:hypothetical protein
MLAATAEPKPISPELGDIEIEASHTDDYLYGAQLAAIAVSLMLGMFLVALDNVSCTLSSRNRRADRRCC